MCERYVELGGSPEWFWGASPKEVFREMTAMSNRMKSELETQTDLAWYNALLTRVKKFPSLKEIQAKRTKSKPKPQSPEVQLAMMEALFTGMGGKLGDKDGRL